MIATVMDKLALSFAGVTTALKSKTGRATQLVLIGQVLGAGLGFIANVILIRRLTVDDYGLFSLFNSTLMILSGFIHLGWIETYVRFGARFRDNTGTLLAIRGFIFRRMLGYSGVITVGVLFLGAWISTRVYHRPDFTPYFWLAAVGGWITCLFSFAHNDYRAREQYQGYFTFQVAPPGVRVLLILFFLAIGALSLVPMVSVYCLTPLPFLAWALLRKDGILKRPSAEQGLTPDLVRDMRQYTGWLLVSIFSTNITGNIDSHILAYYHGNDVLSAFGVAGRLTLPISFVVSALTITMLPKLSHGHTPSDIRRYLTHLKPFMIVLAAMILAAYWFAVPVLIWIAGPKYQTIGPLIELQILTMLIVFLTNPTGLILYAKGWSKGFAILNLIQLVVDLILDLLWIPSQGALGAVRATLVMNLIGLVFVYGSVWHALREKKPA